MQASVEDGNLSFLWLVGTILYVHMKHLKQHTYTITANVYIHHIIYCVRYHEKRTLFFLIMFQMDLVNYTFTRYHIALHNRPPPACSKHWQKLNP